MRVFERCVLYVLIISIFITSASPAVALEPLVNAVTPSDVQVPAPKKELSTPVQVAIRSYIDPKGNTVKFRILKYKNEMDEVELRYDLIEERLLLWNMSVPVLYARDINMDGAPDAWFMVDDSGVLGAEDRFSNQEDGWDVAQDLLRNKMQVHNRSYLNLIWLGLGELAMFTSLRRDSFVERLTRDQLYLYDFEIYLNRLQQLNSKDPMLSTYYTYLSQAWQEIDSALGSEMWKRAGMGVVDLVVQLATAAIGKGMSWLGGKVSALVAETRAAALARTAYGRFTQGMTKATQAALSRLGRAGTTIVASKAIAKEAFALLTPTKKIVHLVNLAHKKGGFYHFLAKALVKSYKVTSQLAYIAYVQSLQMAIEMSSRKMWDKSPTVMLDKISNDKDLLQNMGFMTLETGQMAAVSAMTHNVGRRMRVSGVISMVDSLSMSLYVKHEKDPYRVAGDTAWEVIIGNSQTQFDMWAQGWAKDLATRHHKPGLKLLGWALVTIDQGLGYWGYFKATDMYEKHKQQTPNIYDKPNKILEGPTIDRKGIDQSQRIELVPIYQK